MCIRDRYMGGQRSLGRSIRVENQRFCLLNIQINLATMNSNDIQRGDIYSIIPGAAYKIPYDLATELTPKVVITEFKELDNKVVSLISSKHNEAEGEVLRLYRSELKEEEIILKGSIAAKLDQRILDQIKNKSQIESYVMTGSQVKIRGLKDQIGLFQNEFFKSFHKELSDPEDVPNYWENLGNSHFKEVLLPNTSPEFRKVADLFRKTLSNRNIHAISRIQNIILWQRYVQAKKEFMKKYGYQTFNEAKHEMLLFHGINKRAGVGTRDVINSIEGGLDISFSNSGMWGNGLYFAVNASYSDGYAETIGNGRKLFLVCQVLVGEIQETGTNNDNTLKKPKINPANQKRFDSVGGFTNGSQVYIVYENHKCYPAYLIEFS
eukprot:TRINITY_DN2403_c0_g1_i4.p1 TRINITY_DN2403_c0_g1~~TRINITY_DN2403_c0_g1_i4.p1  ORF type:complete len:379 (+),score=57.88 TRINITY_DN2403_c0_g1_i4:67-1203(+)